MKKNVIIIDYGLGNLFSISQACIHCGHTPEISNDPEKVANADYLILPGMGAFGVAMDQLNKSGLTGSIKEYANSGKPLLGVCLGLQLLFDYSEEFGHHEGLGLVRGKVLRFPDTVNGTKVKIPNIGWSGIMPYNNTRWDNSPLKDVPKEDCKMYFVHSYYVLPDNENDMLSRTNYLGFDYTSSVASSNIYGVQFHPEKSGEPGLTIYKNFLSI